MPDTQKLITAGIALGIAYAVAKLVKKPAVSAAAYGVMGIIVAKNVPFVKEAI